MTSRRVAFVTTSFPAFPGDPAGHFVQAEAERCAASGDRVTVVAPRPDPAPRIPHASGFAAGDGVRVEWLPGGRAFGSPGALARLRQHPVRVLSAAAFCARARRTLRELGPFDDIVAHWLIPSAWPVAVDAGARLEVVVHGSDVRVLEVLPRRAASSLVAGLVARGATFRFVSDDLRLRLGRLSAEDLGARSRVEPSPITVPASLSRETARASRGLRPSESIAVIVGRLVRGKRTDVAIHWARQRAQRVVVIGDGPERERLSSSGAAFLGQLPHPATLEWIAAADYLVSASRDEGAPTVIREARALGVPVVTAPCGDVRQWARVDPGITIVEE